VFGVETVRYETIGELRKALADIEKKTGDAHELNQIASAIFFRHAIWLRYGLGSVVVTANGDALLILLGWGRDVKTWRDGLKAILIAHAKHNGLKRLQVCSPRKGWARVFGIKPQGDLYEVEI
jgi:hypothetical protein